MEHMHAPWILLSLLHRPVVSPAPTCTCTSPTGAGQFAVERGTVGSLTEGVCARLLTGQYGIRRDDLTYAILERARERGAVLMRAPPQVRVALGWPYKLY